jgi:D-threo-aldose 1-dehydrogenase
VKKFQVDAHYNQVALPTTTGPRIGSALSGAHHGQAHPRTIGVPSGIRLRPIDGTRPAIGSHRHSRAPFPALLRRAQQRGSAIVKAGAFSRDAVLQSLESSLRALQTDYVDLLLLHEATLADAANDDLLEILQQQITRGTVRHLGIASAFSKLHADAGQLAPAYKIVQFDDHAQSRNLARLANRDQRLLITHSIFKPAKLLHDAARACPELTRERSRQIGADLSHPDTIASLLLDYALHSNPGGIVLFSSTNPAHVEANVRQTRSPRFDDAQLDLFLAFQEEVLAATQNAAQSFSRTKQKTA